MKKIRKCKYCGNETTVEIGIHNWKNLFRKPTIEDYIMLFIIFMVIFSYYLYKVDINNIIEYYEDENYCFNQIKLNNQKTNIPYMPFQINLPIDSSNESNGE